MLARNVQYRIEKKATEGIMTAYPSDCFMIASADNIYYIHHYARVYCGKQQLSWHGTTVQIAQPKPLTLTTNADTTGERIGPLVNSLQQQKGFIQRGHQ